MGSGMACMNIDCGGYTIRVTIWVWGLGLGLGVFFRSRRSAWKEGEEWNGKRGWEEGHLSNGV